MSYTAINSVLSGEAISGIQNLGLFPSLPEGKYFINVRFPILMLSTGTAFEVDNWDIGGSTGSTLPTSLGSAKIVDNYSITYNPPDITYNSIFGVDFTITSDTSPIYINSVITSAPNDMMFLGDVFKDAVIVATKTD